MELSLENGRVVHHPTAAQIERALRSLKGGTSTEFAILDGDGGSFVQVAGSQGGCMVEWRDGKTERVFRAHQAQPVVPFEDGTVLAFSGSEVVLRRDEWFRINQAIEIFQTFAEARPFPSYVLWRDITPLLYPKA